MATRDESKADEAGDESRYGDELLRANWNPVIELLQWSSDRTRSMTDTPAARSDEEAAAFLRRIYTSGA